MQNRETRKWDAAISSHYLLLRHFILMSLYFSVLLFYLLSHAFLLRLLHQSNQLQKLRVFLFFSGPCKQHHSFDCPSEFIKSLQFILFGGSMWNVTSNSSKSVTLTELIFSLFHMNIQLWVFLAKGKEHFARQEMDDDISLGSGWEVIIFTT